MSKEQKNGFLGLGGLFRTIKSKIMGGFITNFLAGIFEKFKVANPKIGALVVVLALGLQFGFDGTFESLLATIGIIIDLPPGFLSLDYILGFIGHPLSDKATDVILMVLGLLSGAKSTEFLEPKKRDEKIKEQATRIQRRELRRIEKQEKQAAKDGL